MSFMRKLTDDQRKFIEKLLRDDRHTLNEMLDEIRAEFPVDAIPSSVSTASTSLFLTEQLA